VTPTPAFPPGRYGRRRDPAHQRRARVLGIVVAGLVVAGAVAAGVKVYRQYLRAPYQVGTVTVNGITDTGVTVTFEVRKPADAAASCTVRALAGGGAEVGRARVDVPAGTTRITYTLVATKRPVTAEVPGCGPAAS
jgi:hypothetical protein